jgi:sterol desaturase/sphingolipid hydroxylase (fatty acid hydroxylase superfamily)
MPALIQILTHFSWYACLVLFLRVLERRWPAGPPPTRQEQLYDFGLAFVSSLTTTVVLNLASLSNALRRGLGLSPLVTVDWMPSGLLGWTIGSIAYLLAWEFFQYWFHRIQHAAPWLWRMHALHHNTEAISAAAALRNTLWHHVGTTFLVTLPLLTIFDDDVVHPYAAWVFFMTWGFYNHANLRWSHGPFTAVISGPQLHRLHHGKARQYYNCNYAAFFPVLDVVFGTYRAPARDEYPEVGLIDERPSIGGFGHMLLALLGRGEKRAAASGDVDAGAATAATGPEAAPTTRSSASVG